MESIWIEDTEIRKREPLPGDMEVPAVVIGAGWSGIRLAVRVPFLECRHSIWSMKHSVWGKVYINGTAYSFDGAKGYWEGDRGRSFPKEYIWTQCSLPE